MELITDNLFDYVLVQPATAGNQLCIVSGYATPTMASQHLEYVLKKHKKRIKVDLIVGMTPLDGLSLADHAGFQSLSQETELGNFRCSYIMRGHSPVHSKVYIWLQDNQPVAAFSGSPNYTQNAFYGKQQEILAPCDAHSAWRYFHSLIGQTIFCNHSEVEDYVTITNSPVHRSNHDDVEEANKPWKDFPHVTCPLVKSNGEIHEAAGLNWGHRDSRNRNQAYIPVPASIQRSGFFPDRGVHFTCITDDGKHFTLVRAQENGKALETPTKNSLLGEYFRNRLELPNGAFVTTEDLVRHGRTTVDFYKIDDDTYLMDFSSP